MMYFPMRGILRIATAMIAVIKNAAIVDIMISTGVVHIPNTPASAEPNVFLTKPEIGTRISKWHKYMP